MRALFGLVGILVTVGVIVWFLGSGGGLDHTATVLSEGQNARQQVNQIVGNDPQTGERASESADFDGLTNSGRLSGLLVTRVVTDGAYARYFGLQRSDTIVAVQYQGQRMDVRDMNDADMAKAQVGEAYSKRGSVIVVRNDAQIVLPIAKAQSPAAPGQRDASSPLHQQLDAIQNIPGAR